MDFCSEEEAGTRSIQQLAAAGRLSVELNVGYVRCKVSLSFRMGYDELILDVVLGSGYYVFE